jgi:hypothetical protein
MEQIEETYKHFLSITHDRVTAALLTLATQLKSSKDE